MKKFVFFLFPILNCLLIPYVFSQQETVTIATYYPSPVGNYNELFIHQRMAIGDANGDGVVNDLDLAHDNAGNPMNGTLTVANSLGIGTVAPRGELHVRSTDNTNGDSDIILEGKSPATGASTGRWDIVALGGTPGTDPAGNLQFNSVTVDVNGNSTGTTTPMTIEQGAPNSSLYVENNGSVSMNSATGGFIPPRMTTAERNLINPTVLGMIIFNTIAGRLEVYTTSGWQGVGGAMQTVVTVKRYENPDKAITIESYVGATPPAVSDIAEKVELAHGPDAWSDHKLFGLRCKQENGWILTGMARAAAGSDNDCFMYSNTGLGDTGDSSQNKNIIYVTCVKME